MKIAALLLTFLAIPALVTPSLARGTLRIGMTVADIPQTTGQPDQGMEGYRFTGYPAYDVDAINNSYGPIDPATAFPRQFDSANIAPIGFNWGEINDPLIDQLIHQAQQTFALPEQDKLLARVHEEVVNQALYVFIAHDLNPRALSSHVKGFVQAQSWVEDFSPVYIAP